MVVETGSRRVNYASCGSVGNYWRVSARADDTPSKLCARLFDII
jgi:hypothetical protein